MRAARGTWRCGEPPGGIADVREQESRRAAADHLGALAQVRSHGNDSPGKAEADCREGEAYQAGIASPCDRCGER